MKYILLLLFLSSASFLLGQSNDAFTHRAVIMNTNNEPRTLENFEAEVKLLKNPNAPSEVSYAETHSIKTDSLGWYSIKVGSGKVITVNNSFNDIDWAAGETYLHVKVTDTLGSVVSQGITEILSSPKITFAKNIDSKALLTLDCLTNLEALRNFPVPVDGEMICIKGHTSVRDGGEGFFFYKSEMMEADDDGIIIRPKDVYSDKPGRWVRKLDGFININYYGARGGPSPTSVSDKIQKAIDYAANNKYNDWNKKHGRNELTRGNTVYFPNGEYLIDKPLILRDGTSLLGEGFNTFLTAKAGAKLDYIIKMEKGRVICHMEKFVLLGNSKYSDAGGIYLQARYDPADGLGGMSRSKFKNIEIIDVDGHGLVLEGRNDGGHVVAIDNQFNIFENVHIRRNNPEKNALLILGTATENIFLECVFEGDRDMQPTLGANVLFDNVNGRSVGLSFINCGFGLAEQAILMRGAENITLDTCWFENVYTSVQVESSKNINVFGSRFANACGYGSEPPGDNFVPGGQCVSSENSSINIEKNYVLITNLRQEEAFDAKFINARYSTVDSVNFENRNVIVSRDNSFQDPRLSKTFGLVRNLPVKARTITLDGSLNVAADFDGNTVLRNIESTASGGEYITLEINKPGGRGMVKIKDWEGLRRKGNIFLNGPEQLKLTHGQKITFLKVDAPLSNNGDEPVYYLISVTD